MKILSPPHVRVTSKFTLVIFFIHLEDANAIRFHSHPELNEQLLSTDRRKGGNGRISGL